MNTGFYDVNTTGLIKTVGGTQNGYFDDSYFRGFALGPVTTADHFDMLKSIGAVGSVLLINARAQTASDAGQYAATNRANNYPVIAYELANEPQYLPCFAQGVMYCVNGSPALMEYLNAMEPIALAIFAADPNALVAISWMSNPDPSNFNYKYASNWTEWTSAGRQIYWNYTIMHPYPLGNIGNNDVPPDLRYPNKNIVSYLSAELPPDTPIALVDNVPALIDEFSGAIAYNTNITGTLFEGIWSVEFGMRHARTGVIKLLTKWVATGWPSGVDTFPNSRTSPTPQVSGPLFYDQVQTAGKSVPPVVLNTDDTTVFNFNFFPTAQATAYSLLGWATQYATTMPRAILIGTNYLVPTLKYVNVNVTVPGANCSWKCTKPYKSLRIPKNPFLFSFFPFFGKDFFPLLFCVLDNAWYINRACLFAMIIKVYHVTRHVCSRNAQTKTMFTFTRSARCSLDGILCIGFDGVEH